MVGLILIRPLAYGVVCPNLPFLFSCLRDSITTLLTPLFFLSSRQYSLPPDRHRRQIPPPRLARAPAGRLPRPPPVARGQQSAGGPPPSRRTRLPMPGRPAPGPPAPAAAAAPCCGCTRTSRPVSRSTPSSCWFSRLCLSSVLLRYIVSYWDFYCFLLSSLR